MDEQAYEEFKQYSTWIFTLLFVFFVLMEGCIIAGFLLVEWIT